MVKMEKRTIQCVEHDDNRIKKLKSNEQYVCHLWEMRDLIEIIFLFVPIEYLTGLNIICKSWNDVLSKNSFWTKKVLIEFPSFSLIPKEANVDWKTWVKMKYCNINLKYSFSKLKNEISKSISYDKDIKALMKQVQEDTTERKRRINPKMFPCKFQEEIYRDFLINSCIIGTTERKEFNYVTNLKMMSTNGKIIPFYFRCEMLPRNDNGLPEHNEDMEFDYRISLVEPLGDFIYDPVQKRGYKRVFHIGPHANDDEAYFLYQYLQMPNVLTFKTFSTQLIKMLTGKFYTPIYQSWEETSNWYDEYDDSDNDYANENNSSDIDQSERENHSKHRKSVSTRKTQKIRDLYLWPLAVSTISSVKPSDDICWQFIIWLEKIGRRFYLPIKKYAFETSITDDSYNEVDIDGNILKCTKKYFNMEHIRYASDCLAHLGFMITANKTIDNNDNVSFNLKLYELEKPPEKKVLIQTLTEREWSYLNMRFKDEFRERINFNKKNLKEESNLLILENTTIAYPFGRNFIYWMLEIAKKYNLPIVLDDNQTYYSCGTIINGMASTHDSRRLNSIDVRYAAHCLNGIDYHLQGDITEQIVNLTFFKII